MPGQRASGVRRRPVVLCQALGTHGVEGRSPRIILPCGPDRGRRRVSRRVGIGALAAVLLLAATGCDGGDDEAGGSTTTIAETTTSTPTTTEAPTTTLSPEDGVLAAYRAATDAVTAAANPPNPDHPLLAEHLTGEQLDLVRSYVDQLRASNIGHILSTELNPGDVVIAGIVSSTTPRRSILVQAHPSGRRARPCCTSTSPCSWLTASGSSPSASRGATHAIHRPHSLDCLPGCSAPPSASRRRPVP